MFESIRKHSKIVMILLFLLIIPSFVLVGIDSNYFSEKSPVVARVDGHKINQTEWDNAHRAETDRIRAQRSQHSNFSGRFVSRSAERDVHTFSQLKADSRGRSA